MYPAIIDAHMHLDMYSVAERNLILHELEVYNIASLITVSNDLPSAIKNLALAKENTLVHPAFGYHPEQALPRDEEVAELLQFIKNNHAAMIALGEIGLPYYLHQANPSIELDAYIELLALFVEQAVQFDKPVALHAVYEDAQIVCDILEKHSVTKAHFHWFKGDIQTVERLIRNGYYISITPDVLYEEEIVKLVEVYPLSQMMVETDGPWPFSGRYINKLTHPKMIHSIVEKIAAIKQQELALVYKILLENTIRFYNLDRHFK